MPTKQAFLQTSCLSWCREQRQSTKGAAAACQRSTQIHLEKASQVFTCYFTFHNKPLTLHTTSITWAFPWADTNVCSSDSSDRSVPLSADWNDRTASLIAVVSSDEWTPAAEWLHTENITATKTGTDVILFTTASIHLSLSSTSTVCLLNFASSLSKATKKGLQYTHIFCLVWHSRVTVTKGWIVPSLVS